MIPQHTTQIDFRPATASHLHTDTGTCPSCGQEIPLDKLEEISGKIALREREQARALRTKLEEQFELEKAQTKAQATADLDAERRKSLEREAAAREEAKQAAETIFTQKVSEIERNSQEQQLALKTKFEEQQAARHLAEEMKARLQEEMQQLRADSVAALETVKNEASAREAGIRADAQQAADLSVAERIAALETARKESEATLQGQILKAEESRAAAEENGKALSAKIQDLNASTEAKIAKLKEDAVSDAARIREEERAAAALSIQDQLAANEKATADANAKATAAEGKLATAEQQHAKALADGLSSQREVLEKAQTDAVNAEKAKAFAETQKLTDKVAELQRALEKKSNEELGEGAEVEIFEALRREFPDDRIDRVTKGSAGADIHHVVMLNGKACGTIIYDSKNHNAFRNEHVAKLRTDKLAAKAEHAILSTHKFPQGTRQIHMDDGVVLANPARVLVIVGLLRQHLVQVHTLRLSGVERESKTNALYEFITSERCTQLLGRVDARAEDLLDQQINEKKWHDAHWKKQGEAFREIQKAKADLDNEISSIIGTAATTTRSAVSSGHSAIQEAC